MQLECSKSGISILACSGLKRFQSASVLRNQSVSSDRGRKRLLQAAFNTYKK